MTIFAVLLFTFFGASYSDEVDVPTPGRPLVTSFSSRSVNLSWTPPPPHMSGPDYGPVLQYVVLVRRGENTSWADSTNMTSDNVAVTNMTVSGLHPFTVYSFRVVAVFAGNVTGVSGESYYMVTLREAPSGSPTITMAHNISSNALYMAWEPPHPLTINGEFLGYKLTYESRGYGRGEGDSKQSVLIKNPDMREYMLRDLATYTQYTLALQVVNPEGEGPATKVMVMTDEGVPSSPMYSTVHTITNTSAVVDWSLPADPNGVIDGYHLYILHNNVTEVVTIKSKDPRIEYNLTDLIPSSVYHVWIRAYTWKHEGESSVKLSVRTDVSAPLSSSVTNVTCHEDNSVSVMWTPCTWSDDHVLHSSARCVYTLQMLDTGSGELTSVTVNTTHSSGDNDVMVTRTQPLTPDTTYIVSVLAASVSLYRSGVTYPAPSSAEVHLHLHDQCHLSYSPHHDGHHELEYGLDGDQVLSPGVIAGIVITSVTMVLIILGMVIWHRFCKESYYYLDESGSSANTTKDNIATQWETEVQHRVTAEQFLAQVKNLHLEGDREFVVHFKEVTDQRVTGQQQSSYEQPFFVDGYKQPRAFMASPLPLPYKFNYFWKQIWEQKVAVIVMLENIAENGKVVCDQYWPELKAQYGGVEVTLQKTEKLANFTIRTFVLTHQNLGKKGDLRYVTHLQYTCWPASGNPSNPLPLLSLIRVSLKLNELRNAPMLVHTNPNNSRAGVFITLASTLKQLKVTGEINIPSFLKQAPTKGQHLLRSAKDFIFIHDTMVEAIVAGDTNIKKSYLSRYINSLQSCQYSSSGNTFHIERQHDLLNIDFVKKDKALTAPVLDQGMLWLPGYYSQQSYVLSAYPQTHQLQQFWRNVLEHNVHTIVVVKSDQQSAFPDLSSGVTGPVTVTHRDDEISYDFKSKNFILQFGASMRRFVKVILTDSFITSAGNIEDNVSLLETVDTRHKTINKTAPIFVLDSSLQGAAGASLCALLTIKDQLEAEQHCDVYQAVKTVNLVRRGVWSSPDTLLHIYKVAEMLANKPHSSRNSVNTSGEFFQKKSQFQINVSNWKNTSKPHGSIPVPVPIVPDGWF